MRRRAISIALLLLISGAHLIPSRVAASPPGSVTWTVDHQKKTITALVRIQLYSGCSGDPYGDAANQARACSRGTSEVTQFLADKIKAKVEGTWNKGYHFKCYRLIVIMDITLAPNRAGVAPDRIGVRIDPSAVNVRSWVHPEPHGGDWSSDDPGSRISPSNDDDGEVTTWSERAQGRGDDTYAHEVGHLLGLSDTYTWSRDPGTGKINWQKIPQAPDDLMNGGTGIDQKTIDRLLKRNSDRLTDTDGEGVKLDELRCEPEFMAILKADQDEYEASNFKNSAPRCPFPPTTGSMHQTLKIDSDGPVGVRAVKAGTALGYVLVPTFDAIVAANGMSEGRSAAAVGMFDLPVGVRVTRIRAKPASGDAPKPFDINDNTCPGGDDGGGTVRNDCGQRTYNAWLTIIAPQPNEAWTEKSSLPDLLKDLGYSQLRLGKLYKACPGPTPWPGAFGEERGGVYDYGEMPSLETLQQLSDAWTHEGKGGAIDVAGRLDIETEKPGSLVRDVYTWTLTLCPVNSDGATPPGCLA